jgi:zinc transporter ZupT
MNMLEPLILDMIGILIFAAFLGIIPAAIAYFKGKQNIFLWWFFGFMLVLCLILL